MEAFQFLEDRKYINKQIQELQPTSSGVNKNKCTPRYIEIYLNIYTWISWSNFRYQKKGEDLKNQYDC